MFFEIQPADRYAAPDSEAKRNNTSQWSNVQNAQNNYMTNTAAVDGEIDDEFAQATSIANPVSQNAVTAAQSQSQILAQQQAQAGMRASTTPFASSFMLGSNFATNFIEGVTNPVVWAESAMDRFGESNTGRMLANTIMPQSREMYLSSWSNVRLEYSRMSAYGADTNFFSQSVYSDSLSSDVRDMFTNGLKYGGSALLTSANSLFRIFDISKATEDVYNAPPGQAGWVALKEYGAIYVAFLGAGPGEAVGGVIGAPGGPVTEAVGAVAGGVVGASAAASLWMTTVDDIHQHLDPTEDGWSNRP